MRRAINQYILLKQIKNAFAQFRCFFFLWLHFLSRSCNSQSRMLPCLHSTVAGIGFRNPERDEVLEKGLIFQVKLIKQFLHEFYYETPDVLIFWCAGQFLMCSRKQEFVKSLWLQNKSKSFGTIRFIDLKLVEGIFSQIFNQCDSEKNTRYWTVEGKFSTFFGFLARKSSVS